MERDEPYYYQRAETELKLAQQANDPAVVKAHYQLAGYYLDRVYGDGNYVDLSPRIDLHADHEQGLREKAARLADQLRAAGVIIVEPPGER